MVGSI